MSGLIALTFIAVLVPFSPSMPITGLDPSWMLGLEYAFGHHLGYGSDVVFTYGPYASIATRLYTPHSYSVAMLWSIYLSICYTVLVSAWNRDGSRYYAAALCLVASAFTFGYDPILFIYPLLLLAYILFRKSAANINQSNSGRFQYAIYFLISIPIGFLPLIKVSLLFICIPVLFLCILCLFKRHSLKAVLTVLAAAVIGCILPWYLAGQPIDALPRFFHRAFQISGGYTGAMALYGPVADYWWFALGLMGVLLAATYQQRPTLRYGAFFLSFLLIAFLAFKEGFVRHDGHALIAAAALALLAVVVPLVARGPLAVPCSLVGVLCAAGLVTSYVPDLLWPVRNVAETYGRAYEGAVALVRGSADLQGRYDQAMREIAAQGKLPRLPGSSDIYPWDIAYLLASGNRWNPRPVFQSYSAYTPPLQQVNIDHILGEGAPDNVFFKVMDIDGRYPAFEDGASWPALLTRYRPVDIANGFAVLKKRDPDGLEAGVKLRQLADFSETLGQSVNLPDLHGEPIFAEISVRKSLLGEALNIGFKLPKLSISVRMTGGEERIFRFIPGIASSPFLLSPFVVNTTQFVQLFGRRRDLRYQAVAAIRVGPAAGSSLRYWEPQYSVKLYSLGTLPHDDIAEALGLVEAKVKRISDGEFPVGSCNGPVDIINYARPSPGKIAVTDSVLMVQGWLANSTSSGKLPSSTYIYLKSGATAYFFKATMDIRPDVAAYYHVAELKNSGYKMQADTKTIPDGMYTLKVAYETDGQMYLCPKPSHFVRVDHGTIRN